MSVRVGIDVGGTFTDLALFDEESRTVIVTKSPSTPDDPIRGVAAVLEKTGSDNARIRDLVHGTTVATNALLERKRQLPGLLTTRGFRDVVFIQRMNRKHHYDLQWDKPKPYVERRNCLELDERIDHTGAVRHALDEDAARAQIRALRAAGVQRHRGLPAVLVRQSRARAARARADRRGAIPRRKGLALARGVPALARVRPHEHDARGRVPEDRSSASTSRTSRTACGRSASTATSWS